MSCPPLWRDAVRSLCSAALLAAFTTAAPVHAQERDAHAAEEEITIDAKSLSYDKKLDAVSASGDVVIRRGDSFLYADQVELNRQTNEAQATGNAVLVSPDAEIHADSMYIDLDSETGELSDAHIHSDRLGYTLSGERIEKRIGQSYRIENGKFTTCNCAEGPPTWSIAGDALDVALDGYGYLEGGKFQVLDWPVAWVPRAAFPVFRERQSGFLIPRVGFSNRRGFQLLQPYYWAINKNQDATVSADIESAQRLGLLAEYRYALSQATFGTLQVGYFNEAIRSQSTAVRVPPGINPTAPINRWGMIGNHTQMIGSVQGYADLLLVRDNLFLREMNSFTSGEQRELHLRTIPFTTSRLGLLQGWDRAFVQVQGTYYQDLVGPAAPVTKPPPFSSVAVDQDESLVIQRAPDVDLFAQKQLGLGVMGDFTGSATYFARGTGLTGMRGDFRPAAELRLPLGPSLFGALHAAVRETAYGLTQNRMENGFTGTDQAASFVDLPSSSSRELFELSGDVGTQFGRIFDFPYFGLDKLKHTIEPTLDYRYIPPVDQGDLPVFDGIDRINKRSMFTYGVASRLLGRSASQQEGEHGDIVELMRVSATQSYDFLRNIPPVAKFDQTTGTPQEPGTGDHFSDIDFSLRVNPNRVTAVRAFATYNASQNQLSSTAVGVRFRQPESILGEAIRPRLVTRATFNVEYRFVTENILQLLDSSVALPITDRVAGLYAMRYDINAGTFLENYIGMRLLSSCDCWALNLGMTQTRNPNEFQVQAQFTLAGLGAPIGGLSQY